MLLFLLRAADRSRSSTPALRLSRPLRRPAHLGPTARMTTTHRGAAAHLAEEGAVEGEGALTPSVDWSFERTKKKRKGASGNLIDWYEGSPGLSYTTQVHVTSLKKDH